MVDEYKYNIDNWIYGDICLHHDETINEVLWLMLSNKDQLLKLQNS